MMVVTDAKADVVSNVTATKFTFALLAALIFRVSLFM